MKPQAYRLLVPARRDGRIVGHPESTVYGIGTSHDGVIVTNLPGSLNGWRAIVPEDGLAAIGEIPAQEPSAVMDAQRYLDAYDTDGADSATILAHYASLKAEQIGEALSDPAAVHVNMLRGTVAVPSVRALLHAHSGKALEAWLAAERVARVIDEAAPVLLPLSRPGEPAPAAAPERLAQAVADLAAAAALLGTAMADLEGRGPDSP